MGERAAVTRVLVDTASGVDAWSTVGASDNLIEASLLALIDSFQYGLVTERTKPAGAT